MKVIHAPIKVKNPQKKEIEAKAAVKFNSLYPENIIRENDIEESLVESKDQRMYTKQFKSNKQYYQEEDTDEPSTSGSNHCIKYLTPTESNNINDTRNKSLLQINIESVNANNVESFGETAHFGRFNTENNIEKHSKTKSKINRNRRQCHEAPNESNDHQDKGLLIKHQNKKAKCDNLKLNNINKETTNRPQTAIDFERPKSVIRQKRCLVKNIKMPLIFKEEVDDLFKNVHQYMDDAEVKKIYKDLVKNLNNFKVLIDQKEDFKLKEKKNKETFINYDSFTKNGINKPNKIISKRNND